MKLLKIKKIKFRGKTEYLKNKKKIGIIHLEIIQHNDMMKLPSLKK